MKGESGERTRRKKKAQPLHGSVELFSGSIHEFSVRSVGLGPHEASKDTSTKCSSKPTSAVLLVEWLVCPSSHGTSNHCVFHPRLRIYFKASPDFGAMFLCSISERAAHYKRIQGPSRQQNDITDLLIEIIPWVDNLRIRNQLATDDGQS